MGVVREVDVPWSVVVVSGDREYCRRVAQLVRSALSSHSCEVQCFSSASEAAIAVTKQRPHCVLLDHALKDISEIQELSEATGAKTAAGSPIIVLTRATQDPVLDGALMDLGVQGYLHGDALSPLLLMHAIENAVKHRRVVAQLRDREATLLERETQLQLALEAARLMYFSWDVVTDRVERRVSSFPDLPSTDAAVPGPTTFASVAAVVHPEDRERFQANVNAALRGDGRYANAFRVNGPDGAVNWVEERGRVWFDDLGKPLRLTGMTVDVTSHHEAEAQRALAASHQALLLNIASVVLEAPAADAHLSSRIFSLLSPHFGADVLFHYVLGGDNLKLLASHGVPPAMHPEAQQLALNQAFCGTVAATCQPLIADEARIATDDKGAFVRQMSVRAYCCHPLRDREGKLLGTFTLASTTRSAFDVAEVGVFRTVCDFLALAWERQRAEEQVRAREAQLRRSRDTVHRLLERNPFGLFVVDHDFCIRVVSEGTQRGQPAEERLIGRDLTEVLNHRWPPHVVRWIKARFQRTLDTGESYVSQPGLEPRGQRYKEAYDWRIERIEMPEGDLGVVCYFYDLSERRRWELALQESESFYRQVLDRAPGMVFTANADAVCDYVNYRWSEFTGLPSERIIAHGVELIHPEDRRRAAVAAQTVLSELSELDHDLRLRRRDGYYEWFKVRVWPLRGRDGNMARWFGTAVSIDGLKNTESALRARERELNSIADNTPDMLVRYDRELRHVFVNDAVERVTGRKRAFILRRTNLEVGLPAPVCSQLDGALRHALITGAPDMIELTIDGAFGARHYHTQLVPERDATNAVASVLVVSHDVTDRKRFEAKLEEINRRKDDVLGNLVRELRDPLAPLRSGVSALQHASSDVGVVKKASDVMERQLNLMVKVVDELLQDSRLSLRDVGPLPRSSVPPNTAARAGTAASARILIVDDNRDAAEMLALVLQLRGCETAVVFSGMDALSVARSFDPDVVLLDIGLPDMDGHAVARSFQRDAQLQRATLVAVTGWGSEKDKQRSRETGFAYHLVKPVDYEAVEAIIRRSSVSGASSALSRD